MSATRATWPSIVLARCSGGAPTGMPCLPFECRAMPSRTSHVRFRPCAIVLEHVDDAQALLVVIEAAGHQLAQHALAGVAERRVAEVVAERDRLGQLFVQAQHLGDRARDLRDFERVRQARAVVIAGRRKEHLRLVLEAAERLGVDDAIAIALERRPDRIFRLLADAALAVGALRGLRREDLALPLLRAVRGSRRVMRAAIIVAARKLVPCASGPTPKFSASVWPRSANVARVPRSTPALTPRPVHQHRHVLARMIGARRGRIVAVIGGDHQQIVVRAASAAGRRAAHRTARGSRRSRACRCDGRRPRRSRPGSRRSARAPASPSALRSCPRRRRRSWSGSTIEMPRPANRSETLPTDVTWWPRATSRSSSVSRDRRHRVVVTVRRCAGTIRAGR